MIFGKKKNPIDELLDEIKKIFNSLFSIKQNEKISYDGLWKRFDEYNDFYIFNYEEKTTQTFAGGKLFISLDEKSVIVKCDYYFTENGQWKQSSVTNEAKIESFEEDCLSKLKSELNPETNKIEKNIVQKTYDDFMNEISDVSDGFILNYEKDNSASFKDGICKIALSKAFVTVAFECNFIISENLKNETYEKVYRLNSYNKSCRELLKEKSSTENFSFEVQHP